jgi:hypothetical protein
MPQGLIIDFGRLFYSQKSSELTSILEPTYSSCQKSLVAVESSHNGILYHFHQVRPAALKEPNGLSRVRSLLLESMSRRPFDSQTRVDGQDVAWWSTRSDFELTVTIYLGRSLHSCKSAFQKLQILPPPPILRPTGYAPIQPQPAPPASRKRPLPSNPQDRAILPRPAVSEQSNGENLVINQLSASEILEPHRKKRGRPSNKDLEERRAAAAARGEPYESPKPSASRKPKKRSLPATSAAPTDTSEPTLLAAASPDPLQTPLPLARSHSGDSSSGKKRKRGANSDAPGSPVSASKKRGSPRSTKYRSLEQSPTTSAPKSFHSTQPKIPETQQFPRSSINQLLSSADEQAASRKPEDVQMAGTEAVESDPITRPEEPA